MAKANSNPIASAVVFAVIGALGIALAFWLSTSVNCGGDVMRPGDRCLETTDDGSTWYTYDEYQAKQQKQGLIFGGIGGLFLLGAVGVLVVGRRDRRRQQQESDSAAAWTQAS